MASRRRKTTRRSRGSRTLGSQAGYLWEGLRLVLGWIGALVLSVAALLRFLAVRAWEAFHGERARVPLGMVLAGASLFLFVALLDYRVNELPSENLCGAWGWIAADRLLRFFGVGAFLPPLFGIFWGFARMLRESEGKASIKLLGVLVLTLAVSLIAAGLAEEGWYNPSFPLGLGGWLGTTGHPRLLAALGSFGLAVVLALLALLAFLLATEWAFVPLARDLLSRARRGFVQPELPLDAPEDEETVSGHGFLTGLRGRLASFFRPFLPAEEAAVAVAVAGAGGGTAAARRGRKEKIAEREASAEEPLRVPLGLQEAEAGEETEEEDEEASWEEAEDWEEGEEDEEDDEDEEAAEWEEGEEEDEEEAEEEGEATPHLPGISGLEEPTLLVEEEDEDVPVRRSRPKKPRLDSLPSADLLRGGEKRDRSLVQAEVDALGARLQGVFDAFGLDARVVGAERGPTLTLFEVQLASGVSVKKLKNQRDDLGVALGSHGVRIVYPLPGRSTVGVEVPNLKREMVRMKDVFEEVDTSWPVMKLPMVLGRDTLGKAAAEDLTVMPHMLIAGTTGSGKSVCLNAILCTWLLTRGPEQLRLVLIDPKQVELQLYRDIPHLLCPVVTDMKRAPFTLEWATRQMEDRLHMFKMAGVRNITDYNGLGRKELQRRLDEDYDPDEFPDSLPFIVLVIDELADLMLVSAKEVEIAISRLAAKARAAGIHLLVATQRPSTDVVTGLIKMNLPVRMAFKVSSAVDSRVILDDSGADALLGNGDFLYRPPGAAGMIRGQGAFVSEREVREICDHLRAHGKPEYLEELVQMKGPGGGEAVDDPLWDDAVRIILQSGRGSASLLQRALSIGYTRASRLVDLMTEHGILGPHTGSKAREILLTLEEWEEMQKRKGR